jgi:hypothetical protein
MAQQTVVVVGPGVIVPTATPPLGVHVALPDTETVIEPPRRAGDAAPVVGDGEGRVAHARGVRVHGRGRRDRRGEDGGEDP